MKKRLAYDEDGAGNTEEEVGGGEAIVQHTKVCMYPRSFGKVAKQRILVPTVTMQKLLALLNAWQPDRMQHSTAQHSTAQHSTAQHSRAQHSAALCCAAHFSSKQLERLPELKLRADISLPSAMHFEQGCRHRCPPGNSQQLVLFISGKPS